MGAAGDPPSWQRTAPSPGRFTTTGCTKVLPTPTAGNLAMWMERSVQNSGSTRAGSPGALLR